VSVSIFALALAALALAASLSAPPALPPETTGDGSGAGQPDSPPPPDPTPPPDQRPPPELSPLDGGRTSLPPGLEPVPFPLEQQRHVAPTPIDPALTPVPPPQPAFKRRSIVDLRDPFDRPPPRPRPAGQQDHTRLLMPDLKDPFAPGLRRVRSQRLDMYVPNDIRDPFRDRPRADGLHPPCARTTDDGTVVQKPGSPPPTSPQCQPSVIDLRDPFTRDR
jgi:hypothetical protein